jgi:hypothetical protein
LVVVTCATGVVVVTCATGVVVVTCATGVVVVTCAPREVVVVTCAPREVVVVTCAPAVVVAQAPKDWTFNPALAARHKLVKVTPLQAHTGSASSVGQSSGTSAQVPNSVVQSGFWQYAPSPQSALTWHPNGPVGSGMMVVETWPVVVDVRGLPAVVVDVRGLPAVVVDVRGLPAVVVDVRGLPAVVVDVRGLPAVVVDVRGLPVAEVGTVGIS